MYRDKRESRNRIPAKQALFIAGIATLMLFNFEDLALARKSQISTPQEVQITINEPGQVPGAFRVQPTIGTCPQV